MEIPGKTREELIIELQELSKENKSLKVLKGKRVAELVIANEEILFQGEEKTETATMKDKRFSFFATQRKKEAKSHRTFGTLPFARHTSQRFAKVKETNLSADIIILTFNSKQCFYFQKKNKFV